MLRSYFSVLVLRRQRKRKRQKDNCNQESKNSVYQISSKQFFKRDMFVYDTRYLT